MHLHSYAVTERKFWFKYPGSVIQHLLITECNKQHEINLQAEDVQFQNKFIVAANH